MVLVIVAIAIAGVVTAFLLKTNTGNGLGSQYKITKLKDNTLIEKGQTDTCTISIVCDTILNNTDNLNEEKALRAKERYHSPQDHGELCSGRHGV